MPEATRTSSLLYKYIPRRMRRGYRHWLEWRKLRHTLPWFYRYCLAPATIGLTLGIRLALELFVDGQAVFLLFILPVAVSAWFGGFVVGLIASILAGLGCDYFFVQPPYTLGAHDTGSLVDLLIFIFEAALISFLIMSLRFTRYVAQKHHDQRKDEQNRFRALIDSVTDYAIYTCDAKGYILSWNDGAERLTGHEAEEVIGKKMSLFYTPEDVAVERPENDLKAALKEGRHEAQSWLMRKDGSRFWASVITTTVRDEQENVVGFTQVIRDMTDQIAAENTIRHQAFHDPLTGLPNRLALQERLEALLKRAARNNEFIGVLFLDLDRFKAINDTLGHQMGDKLLQEVAKRLQESVRSTDIVARFGGDEFVIILSGISSSTETLRIAENILRTLRPTYRIEKHSLHISSCIGIALYPHDGEDVPSLLKNADSALYQCKAAGRDTVKLYTKTMNVRATQLLSLENELRQALNNNQFTLHYQPIFAIKDQSTIAAEALIRWHHPTLGAISPNEFIPLAEETGVIFALGDWVFGEVVRQIEAWKRQGLPSIQIAVNLSPRQFSQPRLLNRLERTLERSRMNPKLLCIEITEGVAMSDVAGSISKLAAINRLGIETAIDDFGTGFSSLNYMRRLPISKLKIDRSFVAHCTTDEKDAAIVKAIISMARSLKLKVVCEGIETPDQLEFLKSLRCEYGQGYLISPPLPAEPFAELIGRAKLLRAQVSTA